MTQRRERIRQTQVRAEETRDCIVEAALELFAARGFDGVTVRDIAARAGRPLSAISYHFASKDELWRDAAKVLHNRMTDFFAQRMKGLEGVDARTCARLILRDFVVYVARTPALIRFMINVGFESSDRLDWYAANLSTPFRGQFGAVFDEMGRQQGLAPGAPEHVLLVYMAAGAAALVHALAPEVRATSGVDPSSDAFVERHIEMMVDLFLPESATLQRRLEDDRPASGRLRAKVSLE
jgi:TetR/AcrR family transcriptional regulator